MGERRGFNPNRKRRRLRLWLAWALVACLYRPCAAQEETGAQKEFWPEVTAYVRLNRKWRLVFAADINGTRESKNGLEAHFGAHADYRVNKTFSLRAGYRYGTSLEEGGDYQEHRVVFEQAARLPLPAKILFSDRTREELRFLSGDFSARYRNRAMLEREFAVRAYKFTPYASGEVFYDTRFRVFNRNRLTAGVQLPLGKGLAPFREHHLLLPRKSLSLDLYFTRQNDSRSKPNHVNAVGATLIFTYGGPR
jgi:hypothetical protein